MVALLLHSERVEYLLQGLFHEDHVLVELRDLARETVAVDLLVLGVEDEVVDAFGQ